MGEITAHPSGPHCGGLVAPLLLLLPLLPLLLLPLMMRRDLLLRVGLHLPAAETAAAAAAPGSAQPPKPPQSYPFGSVQVLHAG